MIKAVKIVMTQSMGPMPIYTIDEKITDKGRRSVEAHMSRLGEKCCGTITIDKKELTDENIETILNGRVECIHIITTEITMDLFMVEFLEILTKEDVINKEQFTFICDKHFIRSFQIL